MEIPTRLLNEILNYLAQQPYKDVANLIGSVLQIQAQSENQTAQEELPLDDK